VKFWFYDSTTFLYSGLTGDTAYTYDKLPSNSCTVQPPDVVPDGCAVYYSKGGWIIAPKSQSHWSKTTGEKIESGSTSNAWTDIEPPDYPCLWMESVSSWVLNRTKMIEKLKAIINTKTEALIMAGYNYPCSAHKRNSTGELESVNYFPIPGGNETNANYQALYNTANLCSYPMTVWNENYELILNTPVDVQNLALYYMQMVRLTLEGGKNLKDSLYSKTNTELIAWNDPR
jgi:hypothetical protein